MATDRFAALRGDQPKHGPSSPTYYSWRAMRARCNDPNDPNYKNYGGRGIIVCARWNDFRLFLEDMGDRPRGTTLDRIDVDGNYSPENCRWATLTEQPRHRTAPYRIRIDGVTRTLAEWCEVAGTPYGTARDRIVRGWTPRDAIFNSSVARIQKGEAHPSSKLTEELVKDIVARHGRGETQAAIAASIGVGCHCVQKILSGKRWQHVTGILPKPK